MRILYLETDKGAATQTLALLKKRFPKVEVNHANSKKVFRKALHASRPDIIISASQIPHYSGRKALRDSHKLYSNIPFIIMAESIEVEDALVFMKEGTLDYIPKNNMKQLTASLQNTLAILGKKDSKSVVGHLISEKQQLYSKLIENTQDIILSVDRHGNINYISEKAKAYGYDPENLAGKSIFEFVYAEDREDLKKDFEKIINTGQYIHSRFRIIGNDKKTHWMEDRGIAQRDKHGKVSGITSILKDITPQKEVEELLQINKETYQALLDVSADAIFLETLDGSIIDCNAAACRMYGYPREKLLSLSVTDIVPENVARELPNLIQKVKSGEPIALTSFNKRKNGEIFPVEINTKLIHIQDQSFITVHVCDISEQRRLERIQRIPSQIANAVHDSENLRMLLWKIQQVIGDIMDTKNFFLALYNPATDTISLPYFSDEKDDFDEFPAGKTLTSYVIRHKQPLLVKSKDIERMYQKGEIEIHGTPSKVWLGVPIMGDDTVKGVVVVQSYTDENAFTQDDLEVLQFISHQVNLSIEHMQADESLKISQRRLRQIIDLVPHMIFAKDAPGKFILANEATAKMFGTTTKEIIGKSIPELESGNEEQHQKFQRDNQAVIQSGQPKFIPEETLTRADGSERILQTTKIPFMVTGLEKPAVLGVAIDITEQKKMQDELRAAHRIYRETIQNAYGVPYHYNMHTRRYDFVGEGIETLLGIPWQKFNQETLRSIIKKTIVVDSSGETDPDQYRQSFFKGNRNHYNVDLEIETPAGQTKWISDICVAIKDENTGEMIGSQGILQDITERIHIREALRESKERYQTLFNSGNDAIYVYKISQAATAGKIIEVNSIAGKLLGFTRQEFLEMTPYDLDASTNHTRFTQILQRLLKEKHFLYETEHITKDGRRTPMECNAHLIEVGGIRAVMTIARDISDRKRMEREIQRSEKMESVGILAGGIAHDFNNILTGILGNISLAKINADIDSEIYQFLQDAEKASNRAKELTQQLLTFSKGGAPVKKVASIADILRDCIAFSLTGSNVKSEFRLEKSLNPADIDVGQINQVINNLVINADQAMPNGGTLTVSATNATITPQDPIPLEPGEYVQITLSDEGIGIPEKYLEKIFDPYFTTKSKGSGLGLASAYSIINNHGGYITVESQLGKGTSFHIYLPASQAKVEKTDGADEIITGEGRILLMDDEESIRRVAREMIKTLGYQVDTAQNGAETIAKYRAALNTPQKYNVVIMDLTIPGEIGGRETLAKLLEIDPEIRAIVSSGYSHDPVMANYREFGFKGVIAKPYRIKEIAPVLKRVLET